MSIFWQTYNVYIRQHGVELFANIKRIIFVNTIDYIRYFCNNTLQNTIMYI